MYNWYIRNIFFIYQSDVHGKILQLNLNIFRTQYIVLTTMLENPYDKGLV